MMNWFLIALGLTLVAGAISLLLMRIQYGTASLRWLRIVFWSIVTFDASFGTWLIYLGITAPK